MDFWNLGTVIDNQGNSRVRQFPAQSVALFIKHNFDFEYYSYE